MMMMMMLMVMLLTKIMALIITENAIMDLDGSNGARKRSQIRGRSRKAQDE